VYDSWNHHIFRLNDKEPDKVKIATNNIMEYTENATSKIVRSTLSTIHFFIALLSVVIVSIIVMVIKNKQKIKSMLYIKYIRNVLQRRIFRENHIIFLDSNHRFANFRRPAFSMARSGIGRMVFYAVRRTSIMAYQSS
jgi:hypothetical protein